MNKSVLDVLLNILKGRSTHAEAAFAEQRCGKVSNIMDFNFFLRCVHDVATHPPCIFSHSQLKCFIIVVNSKHYSDRPI